MTVEVLRAALPASRAVVLAAMDARVRQSAMPYREWIGAWRRRINELVATPT